ncbi:hypothetical protein L596_008771 [Steinernema carpocapsae]|uniref:G-protein coupled receptors family 1 profile domain-containing protein n=1 Tax=Steinernema carpocapsae TaxID=34508 RepID=A0A4V6A6E5_STECR|nr:hypothetical protein L596_008771 [Steinernema carpocapsae]
MELTGVLFYAVKIFIPHVLPDLTVFFSLLLAIINPFSIVFQLRRVTDVSRFGTVFALLLTYFAYLLLSLTIIPKLFVDKFVVHYSFHIFYQKLAILSRNLGPVIVSISSSVLATDRVLIMLVPLRYQKLKLSLKLSIFVLTTNCIIIFVSYSLLFIHFVFHLDTNFFENSFPFKYYGLNACLLLETTLYIVFTIQYRNFTRKFQNQKRHHANHIVVFQMITHTIFCTGPIVFQSIEYFFGTSVDRYGLVQWHEPLLFLIGVVLSSLFILYKLRPQNNSVFAFSTSSRTASSLVFTLAFFTLLLCLKQEYRAES